MLISTPNETIPPTAYGLHDWQLDAWEKQRHPSFVRVTVFRGRCGAYDGWIEPVDTGKLLPTDAMVTSAYICGWLNGRDTKR
jgi:hypothetical protein